MFQLSLTRGVAIFLFAVPNCSATFNFKERNICKEELCYLFGPKELCFSHKRYVTVYNTPDIRKTINTSKNK